MTNVEIAQSYLRQARSILAEAELHLRAARWNLVVRRSQEAVEIALKAVLRIIGIEVPRVHDVGVFLREHTRRLPVSFAKELDRVVSVSRRLRQERETSFYGDEQLGAPPDELYVAEDAEEAFRDACFVVELCDGAIPCAGTS